MSAPQEIDRTERDRPRTATGAIRETLAPAPTESSSEVENHIRDQNSRASTHGQSTRSRTSSIVWLNLALRVVMESGIVLGLAYWGYQTGESMLARIALAIAAPVVGFGFWGTIDFHQAGRAAEGLRLLQELLVSGLTALALWSVGLTVPGAVMAGVSIVYHVLVYASGGRLLKQREPVAG